MIFNIFSIPTFLSALIVAVTGVVVFKNDPKSSVNRALAYFCASIFGWLFLYSMAYCSGTPETAYKWVKLAFVGVSFIPFTNLYFNLSLTENAREKPILLGSCFLITLFFASLSQTPFIYAGMEHRFWGFYPMAGAVYGYFIAFYVSVWLYSLFLLYKFMEKKKLQKDFAAYNKTKYVLIAWSGGFLGIADFLPKYGVPVYPFAYLVGVYWILVSAYSILPVKSRMHMFLTSRKALIASGIAAVLIICSSAFYLFTNLLSAHSVGDIPIVWRFLPGRFTFNPFSVLPIAVSCIILAEGVYIFMKNRASPAHKAFLYFCVSCFVWLSFYGLAYNSSSPETAYYFLRKAFLGVGMIAFTNLYFYYRVLDLPIPKKVMFMIFALACAFVGISQISSLIYEQPYQYFWGFYSRAGRLHSVFLLYWSLVWAYCSWHIYRKIQDYKLAGDFVNYKRARFIFFAYLGECLGFIDFLPKYGIPVYPFGYLVVLYWVLIVAFALIGHRMLKDMAFIMRRILIVSGVAGLLIVLYSVLFSLLQMMGKFHVQMETLIAAAVMVLTARFLLFPLYHKTRDFIDRAFFQEFHQRSERMAELSQKLLFTMNAADFSGKIVAAIYEAFKSIRASFFLLNGDESAFKLQAELNWGGASNPQAEIAIPLDNSLAKFLQTHDYLSASEPEREDKSQILSSFGAQLAIPIKSGEEKLLGFLLLGDKESGLQYTEQDIHDLKAFAKLSAVVARTEQLLLQQIELEKLVEERTRDLITAQEELLTNERLAAIGQMASIISHEIRTPLTILGQSLYLIETRFPALSKDSQIEKHLEIMNSQIRSANNILSEILDYARERPLILEIGHLNRLIYEVTSVTECPAKTQFMLNLSKDIPESMFDHQEITQAFNNIIKNALESMSKGGILTIETRLDGGEAEICFSDTGCGIPEENIAKIFEPLFTTKKSGTGLGMAVVKKVIDRHGGRIQIQSKVGQGTTIVVGIPLRTHNVKIKKL